MLRVGVSQFLRKTVSKEQWVPTVSSIDTVFREPLEQISFLLRLGLSPIDFLSFNYFQRIFSLNFKQTSTAVIKMLIGQQKTTQSSFIPGHFYTGMVFLVPKDKVNDEGSRRQLNVLECVKSFLLDTWDDCLFIWPHIGFHPFHSGDTEKSPRSLTGVLRSKCGISCQTKSNVSHLKTRVENKSQCCVILGANWLLVKWFLSMCHLWRES